MTSELIMWQDEPISDTLRNSAEIRPYLQADEEETLFDAFENWSHWIVVVVVVVIIVIFFRKALILNATIQNLEIWYSFSRSFILSFIHTFIHLFIHSFTRLFIHLCIYTLYLHVFCVISDHVAYKIE